jgi:hypothetical protein
VARPPDRQGRGSGGGRRCRYAIYPWLQTLLTYLMSESYRTYSNKLYGKAIRFLADYDSRSVTLAARLKNASRISEGSVSSAHRRNLSACSCNSLADEFEAMTHLVHGPTP